MNTFQIIPIFQKTIKVTEATLVAANGNIMSVGGTYKQWSVLENGFNYTLIFMCMLFYYMYSLSYKIIVKKNFKKISYNILQKRVTAIAVCFGISNFFIMIGPNGPNVNRGVQESVFSVFAFVLLSHLVANDIASIILDQKTKGIFRYFFRAVFICACAFGCMNAADPSRNNLHFIDFLVFLFPSFLINVLYQGYVYSTLGPKLTDDDPTAANNEDKNEEKSEEKSKEKHEEKIKNSFVEPPSVSKEKKDFKKKKRKRHR